MWNNEQSWKTEIELYNVKHELHVFYTAYDAAHVGHPASRISKLTMKMIGKKTERKLKLKAAETYGLLNYLVDRLRRSMGAVGPGAKAMLDSGELLVSYVEALKSMDPVLTLAQRQVYMTMSISTSARD